MTRAAERIGTVLLLLAWAFPLYWMLVASLTPESRLFGVPQMVPRSLGLAHYRALFGERQFWLPIRNSLIVAGATTVLAVLLGAPCAYAMARLQFRAKSWLLAIVMAVSMFPQISVVSPLFLLLRSIGLIDTFPGLVLPYLTFAMPLAIWLMSAFLRELPREIEDAARLDGAALFERSSK
jgi:ABC-type glycerol-3-phosphate transport system permease component